MKKLGFLLMVICFGFLNSCSNKTKEIDPNLLIGKWENTQVGTLVNGEEVLQNYPNHCNEFKDRTEFTDNGELISTEFSSDCKEMNFRDRYKIENQTITIIKLEGKTTTTKDLEIEILDQNTLKLSSTESFGGNSQTYISVMKKIVN